MLVEEKHEYVRLVARQLRAQQLGLVNTVKAGGGVFAVGKPENQVAVASEPFGTADECLLLRSRQPPKPRRLASPTALALLECPQHGHIRCSKRDGSCWFDQLSLLPELQRWMGRPPVTLEELRVIEGLSHDGQWASPGVRTWRKRFCLTFAKQWSGTRVRFCLATQPRRCLSSRFLLLPSFGDFDFSFDAQWRDIVPSLP